MPLSQIVSASIEDGAVAPVDLSSVAQYTGFKNRLINGGFGIWQRGTSSTTNGVYATADRWLQVSGTSATWSRSTDVPSGFQYSMSVAGTNFPQVIQRIESVNCTDLASQDVTLSFWVKQATPTPMAAYLQYANATDNWTTSTTIANSVLVLTGTTSWVKYSITVSAMPSQSVNGLQVIIYANTAGAATFLITGVQLEKGVTATSFDYRPYGTELALCQRYYESTDALYSTSSWATIANQAFWKVTKRTSPTIVNTPAAGSGGVYSPFQTGITTVYQSSNNSVAAGGTLTGSAEL